MSEPHTTGFCPRCRTTQAVNRHDWKPVDKSKLHPLCLKCKARLIRL